ncbi:MAG: alpha/beta hydrolase [Actinomycetota bacterium]
MSDQSLAGFRSAPDPSVTSATRPATGAEFKSTDRQAGWLVVNRWTYRPLRRMTSLFLPKLDTSGVQLSEEPSAGRGMRIVRPETITGEGALFLIHGGGYVLGTSKEILPQAVMLARRAGVSVFCPSYRLGPEDPFPAGLDDCHAGWQWLLERAPELGIDPTKLVVGGYSAGGGLGAALVQRLHDEGGQQPAAQLLVYPMLDDRTAANTDLDRPRHRVWSNANNRFGWTGYLGHAPGEASPPYAVPARRDDVRGLPPAWIGVGTPDVFLDEDRAYAERLEAAGVEVTYVEVDGAIHGFDGLGRDTPLVKAFKHSAASFVARFTA